jgi:hypothetical protein
MSPQNIAWLEKSRCLSRTLIRFSALRQGHGRERGLAGSNGPRVMSSPRWAEEVRLDNREFAGLVAIDRETQTDPLRRSCLPDQRWLGRGS